MTISGIDHIEMHVADLDAAAAHWNAFGFTAGPGLHGSSLLLRHGPCQVLLRAGQPAAGYVRRHGDGVAMIAFRTDDVRAAFAQAVAAGAEPLAAPDFQAGTGTAQVSGFGDVTHRLVEGRRDGDAGPGPVFGAFDHIAVCLPAGQLDATARFYTEAFGLTEVFDERIEVSGQAMMSKVVQDRARSVTFTLIEPDPRLRPGQIDQFLDAHGGAGVQHLALQTPDIAAAVRLVSGHGIEFLGAPDGYYQSLRTRVGSLALGLETLRELNILADRDRWGQLFQIFTRSAHDRRTFFLELIERQGALTFGSGNIRALYAALGEEQAAVPQTSP